MRDEDDKKLTPTDIKSVAGNFIGSLKKWQTSGRPVVTKADWEFRLKTCRECSWWQEFAKTKIARCKKCGCSSAKLLLATSKCPLNPPKWSETV